jgi:hypothetical protein
MPTTITTYQSSRSQFYTPSTALGHGRAELTLNGQQLLGDRFALDKLIKQPGPAGKRAQQLHHKDSKVVVNRTLVGVG